MSHTYIHALKVHYISILTYIHTYIHKYIHTLKVHYISIHTYNDTP